mgnify:CR=1 FL=1
MATGTLTSTTIAATYKSLLKVKGGANQVLDGTPRLLEDGDGNDSVLGISTDSVLISGSGTRLDFNTDGSGEYISGDGTDLTITAGNDIIFATAATGSVYYAGGGGSYNTIFGKNAGIALASGGDYNTVFGEAALLTEDTGDKSVAIGYGASYYQNVGDGTSGNVSVGTEAGMFNVTGANNTYLGHSAGYGASGESNSYNTAVGMSALLAIEDGSYNTALGAGAGIALTDGDMNVIVGQNCGVGSTSGTKMVIIGRNAGRADITAAAIGSVLIGYNAGATITSGAGNVAIGYQAGAAITDGIKNIHIGYGSGDANTASNNLSIGYDSLGALADSGATQNIAIGNDALKVMNANCDNNVVIGHYAGDALNGAGCQNNVLIGTNTGSTDTNDLADADNNVLIGHSVAASSATASNQIVIGASATGVADNSVTLGDDNVTAVYLGDESDTANAVKLYAGYAKFQSTVTSTPSIEISDTANRTSATMYIRGENASASGELLRIHEEATPAADRLFIRCDKTSGNTNIFTVDEDGDVTYAGGISSDEKMKANIKDCVYGLEDVNKIKPRKFQMKNVAKDGDGAVDSRIKHGFIAQETESVLPDLTYGDSSEDAECNMSFDYNGMIAVLVKAVQELSAKVEELESKIN